MSYSKKIIVSALFSCIILFSGSVSVHGQADIPSEANSASVYSYLGLGTPYDYLSPFASGMSLSGVAIPDPRRASLANPALWGTTVFTNMSGGMSLEYFDSSDDFGSSQNTNIDFSQIHLVLPVLEERLAISAAMYPRTTSRFQVRSSGSFQGATSDSVSTVNYDVVNQGTGGLNNLELGFGLRITENILVGYASSLMFGVQRASNTIAFDRSAFNGINYERRTRYRGFSHRFGLAVSTNQGVFRSRDRMMFGATVNLPTNLSAHRRYISELRSDQMIDDVVIIPEDRYGERTMRYPLETAFGVSYFTNPYTLFSAEFQYQEWSEYRNFDEIRDPMLSDRVRVGLGFEFDAASRNMSGFFNSFAYRAGASWDSGHLTFDGTDIETLLFSVGLGIPARNRTSSIDVSFDYGFRGTQSNNLVAEKIFGFRVSFNLTERMFRQRRLN